MSLTDYEKWADKQGEVGVGQLPLAVGETVVGAVGTILGGVGAPLLARGVSGMVSGIADSSQQFTLTPQQSQALDQAIAAQESYQAGAANPAAHVPGVAPVQATPTAPTTAAPGPLGLPVPVVVGGALLLLFLLLD